MSQYMKDLYYLIIGKISVISLFYHRLNSRKYKDNVFLHVGCGKNYIKGMVNIDGNVFCKKDIWLDVTLGLPFSSDRVQGVYASFFIEHFNRCDLRRMFREFYRVLKPGGALRIVVPSLEYAIKMYSEGKPSSFTVYPEEYKSIGGRFNNFLLCANEHRLMFDFSLLEELLSEAGFVKIFRAESRQSSSFREEWLQNEYGDDNVFLCVESIK